jgi:tetratricopeptide (TPR) repeat protein
MPRTLVTLLGLGTLVLISLAPAAAQRPAPTKSDDRLVTARRLQREATEDLRLGRPRAGIPKARQAVALREAARGPEHGDVSESLSTLADLLQEAGDYPAARALYERALATNEKIFGPVHARTASSLNVLGYAVYFAGDLVQARKLVERGLAIRESVFGPDHLVPTYSLNNLGLILNAQGDLAGARAAFERALAIRERVSGPDHPLTAIVLGNLADVLRDSGDRAGARRLLERAVKIREAHGPTRAGAGNPRAPDGTGAFRRRQHALRTRPGVARRRAVPRGADDSGTRARHSREGVRSRPSPGRGVGAWPR